MPAKGKDASFAEESVSPARWGSVTENDGHILILSPLMQHLSTDHRRRAHFEAWNTRASLYASVSLFDSGIGRLSPKP